MLKCKWIRGLLGRRPETCSHLPKREWPWGFESCGRPRGCYKCGGRRAYTKDGRAALRCGACGDVLPFDACILCGGKQGISLSGDGADRQCKQCGMVEDRMGIVCTLEEFQAAR